MRYFWHNASLSDYLNLRSSGDGGIDLSVATAAVRPGESHRQSVQECFAQDDDLESAPSNRNELVRAGAGEHQLTTP